MESEKVLCVYHNSDLDGICSAAIVYQYFNDIKEGSCILHGMDYGDEFPWSLVDKNEVMTGDTKEGFIYDKVVMVDFSLSKENMERLDTLTDLIWIDHHSSVMNRNQDIEGVRDVNYAACELTYRYFHYGVSYIDGKLIDLKDVPLAVILLGRYDVWDHTDKRVLPFQYGMRLDDLGPYNSDWGELFKDPSISDPIVNQIIENGKLIESYQDIQDYKYINKYGFMASLEFEDNLYKVLCLNKGLCNSNISNKYVSTEGEYDIFMTFVYHKYFWRVSLYSIGDLDVSKIAKAFNGGGHKNAAGFTCEELMCEEYNGTLFIEMGPPFDDGLVED